MYKTSGKTSGIAGLNKTDAEGIYRQIGYVVARKEFGNLIIDEEEKRLKMLISQSFDGKIQKKLDLTTISDVLKNTSNISDLTETERKQILIDHFKKNGLTIK